MALHPQARALLAAPDDGLPVTDPAFDIDASRAEARAAGLAATKEPVDRVEDVDADGVPCRLYVPAGADGTIVHLHGGGFVFHDVEVHDAPARRLANRSGMAVLSVDYRRPPEHRFPAAPDDVDTVLGWLATRDDLPRPTYLHGDSAGGNLALVAALRNPGAVAALALTYPFLDPAQGFASYAENADGFDPTEATWYWQQYAASPDDLTHPDLAPLLSDRLGTLPPTLVVTAEHDPLRDEGEELARRIAEEGVECVGVRILGQLHGFWRHHEVFDAAEPVTRQIAGWCRQHRERMED